MTDVLLCHHAQGLTEGVQALADDLRAAGHVVHAPDAYAGHTFATLEEGLAHARETGFGEVTGRFLAAAEELPAPTAYVGLSLGVMAAQQLAQRRPGALGAVLCESCVPPEEFGGPWPDGVPVQVHGMADDQIFAGEGDLAAAEALVGSVADGELFVYPGSVHLFADRSLPTYDAAAAGLLTERMVAFLDRVS